MNCIELFVRSLESLSLETNFHFIAHVIALGFFARIGFALSDWTIQNWKSVLSSLFIRKKKDR